MRGKLIALIGKSWSLRALPREASATLTVAAIVALAVRLLVFLTGRLGQSESFPDVLRVTAPQYKPCLSFLGLWTALALTVLVFNTLRNLYVTQRKSRDEKRNDE